MKKAYFYVMIYDFFVWPELDLPAKCARKIAHFAGKSIIEFRNVTQKIPSKKT